MPTAIMMISASRVRIFFIPRFYHAWEFCLCYGNVTVIGPISLRGNSAVYRLDLVKPPRKHACPRRTPHTTCALPRAEGSHTHVTIVFRTYRANMLREWLRPDR